MAAARRLPLVVAAMLAGCAQPESDSLSFRLYEDGATLELKAVASPADATIDLEWQMTLENRRVEPCAVAVYAWVGDVDFPDPTLAPMNATSPEDWPATWKGGALVGVGVVEGNESWTFAEAQVDDPSWLIYARYAVATCPNAALSVDARADAVVDYGPWTPDRGMYVELTRMD